MTSSSPASHFRGGPLKTSRRGQTLESFSAGGPKNPKNRAQSLENVNLFSSFSDSLPTHYLKQINEIKIKQHIKHQVNLKEAKKSLKIVQEKHEKINGIYERMQEDQKDDKAGLKQSEAEIKEISKKLDKKSRKLEKVTAVLKVMEKEQVDLNHESSTSKKLLEKQEKELKKNEKLVKKLETEPERLEAEIEGLEQEKVGLKEDEVQAEEEVRLKMDELTGKTDELKDQKSEKEQNLLAQAEEVTEFQKKLNLKNTELKLLTSEYDKIKSQYDTNKAELDNLVSSSQGIDAEEEELDEMRNSLMTYNENLQEIANNIEKIRNSGEKGELSAKLNIEVAKLREKREAHANSGKGGSRLAKFFKQQESEGGLGEGKFYGRLGDLGGIDPEFDIAISTAASSLDSFVCDSNDTASKCIKLLKNHNMGQAHFIALNQMERHRNRCKTIDTPQNAVRLFDQIQVTHERFKPAFWYSIQDTLVSDDIKQAQQLSRDNRGNRWRVVTLNGELIEASGALTGGGGRAKRGKMGQQVVREENRVTVQDVNEIEQKVDELESRVKEIDSELELLESDQRKGVNACRSLEAKIEKKSRDMKKVGDKLKLLEELVPKLEKDCKRLRPKPSETKTLNDDITSLEREYDVAKSRESAVNKEIKQIQDKIKKINDEIQGPAKLRLNEIREGIKENQKNLTKAKADIGKVGRNKKTGEDKIKSLNTEIEEIKVRLVEVEERLGVIETESKTEILKESELKGERKEIQDEFNELNKKLSNFRKNLSEAESKLVDLKHEVKALKSQVSGQDKQVSGIQEDMDAIVLEEIDEEEIERDELENSMNTDDSEESEDSESEKMSNGENEDNPSETGENDDNPNNSETVKNSQNTQTSKSKTQKSKNNQKQELKILSDVELSKQEISTLDREIYIITENSKKLQKNVDLAAIEEFKRRRKIYDKRVLELEKVTHLRNKKRKIVSKLECKRVEDFMAGFNTIKMKLKEMYQMITLGGDADLELVDNLNPFSEGVIFSVRPPSKSWKNISNLSGGEKTLSSLALVFALHYYKPTPFYVKPCENRMEILRLKFPYFWPKKHDFSVLPILHVLARFASPEMVSTVRPISIFTNFCSHVMDEIDAALDFRNVCIIANYIKDRTKNAQFVIISLRAEMFELADRLVGIYKVNDRSRTTTIDPNKVGVILDGSETEGEDQENQENMPPGQQLQQVP